MKITKSQLRRALAAVRLLAARSKKAIAGFIGPAVVILAVPLTQLELPSVTDWKRAAGAAIAGLVAVYFAPKNAE